MTSGLFKQLITLTMSMVMIVGVIVSENPIHEGGFVVGAIVAGYLNGYLDS